MNNSYRDAAIAVLKNTDCSFSYVGDNGSVRSDVKGIRRLMSLAESGFDLSRGYTADRIVGKAAALIMVLLGAKHVYADTLSDSAYHVFEANGVDVLYRCLVPAIINRTGDDICPMEKAVSCTEDPREAYRLLGEKMKQMKIS